ncbi:hypothetical protein ACLKMH_17605 [Psychromonas sp. KJ10-10]|uniref:hypothetical protein n=1 Tax=Psychromonas sp. KJ10-10 TaxID=3391823 RepID=UPI0039B636DD
MNWNKKFIQGYDKSKALKKAKLELSTKPLDTLLIPIFYGGLKEFLSIIIKRIDPKVSVQLHTKEGFFDYLREQCLGWTVWPTIINFEKQWKPPANHPSHSQIRDNAYNLGINWYQIGEELGLTLAPRVRKRLTKNETIAKYKSLKSQFGRYPSRSDLQKNTRN